MISLIWSVFAASRALQGLVAIVLVAVGVKGWLIAHDHKVKKAAVKEVITKLNREAEKIDEQARKAGRSALRPGSFERLRKSWCEGCDLSRPDNKNPPR